MSIDIDGGLFVGCSAYDISYNEDLYDSIGGFAEHNNLDKYAPWYDAEENECFYGFMVENHVEVLSDDFNKLILSIKSKAEDFEELTGTKARLIGMQDVY